MTRDELVRQLRFIALPDEDGTVHLSKLLTAAADYIERTPKVRALEWDKHLTAPAWRCETAVGTYQVFDITHPSWSFDGFGNGSVFSADSAESAKAAAQAHYEAAILSALEPTETQT